MWYICAGVADANIVLLLQAFTRLYGTVHINPIGNYKYSDIIEIPNGISNSFYIFSNSCFTLPLPYSESSLSSSSLISGDAKATMFVCSQISNLELETLASGKIAL